ncbi:MAG: cysteine desulfurase family protein [Vulcanimicrobiota bacterium]
MIYLDWAATAPLRPEALEAMLPYLQTRFGNPSGLHRLARQARQAVESAREKVCTLTGASTVVFTSGGTEAINQAIAGLAGGGHLVTSTVEHSAVLRASERSQRVDRVAVDGEGRWSQAEVLARLKPDTRLVSLMQANNEVGAVFPLEGLRAALPAGVRLHVDAVQAVGRLPLAEADCLSISAHKFGGPKGVGANLYFGEVEPTAILVGGEQEGGWRSGTENVAGIVGLATALELALGEQAQVVDRLEGLSQRLLELLPDFPPTGPTHHRLPGLVSVLVEGIHGEALVAALDQADVAASTGSACSLARPGVSHVLQAMGYPVEKARSSLRLSLGSQTTMEEVEQAAVRLLACVKRLRSLAGKDV